jgi:hypothetical protein
LGWGSIARRDLRLVALELGGEHVAAAGGEAIDRHPRHSARHSWFSSRETKSNGRIHRRVDRSFLMVASVGRMVVASVGITLGRGLNSRTKSG